MDLKWVGCQYPTPALAQEAGMSLTAFADFLYGACLLDWDAERERMNALRRALRGQADEVRLVAGDTDVRLSIAGRPTLVDAGGANMPGGEFFTSPVEDSAEGEIVFGEFPAVYSGREVRGIRLRFEGGKVVDASAEANEEFLLELLDLDEGARRPRRARDRLQPRDHAAHEEHALRREDRRHRPPRARQRPARRGRRRTSASSTGTSSRRCARRAHASSSTAKPCRKAAAG